MWFVIFVNNTGTMILRIMSTCSIQVVLYFKRVFIKISYFTHLNMSFSMVCSTVPCRSSLIFHFSSCNFGVKFWSSVNLRYYPRPCLWVPVTTAWRVLRLRMEDRPPIWGVAANKLKKQSWTAEKGWSSSLGGLGEALTTPPREKQNVLKYSWARCFLWRQTIRR